jgi:hypothetical protein
LDFFGFFFSIAKSTIKEPLGYLLRSARFRECNYQYWNIIELKNKTDQNLPNKRIEAFAGRKNSTIDLSNIPTGFNDNKIQHIVLYSHLTPF